MEELQANLQKWVHLVRRPGQPVVEERHLGDVHVVEVTAYPEAATGARVADVHFVGVAPTDEFPERDALVRAVLAATGEGEFASITAKDLANGPSFVALGGWLGSQDLALMLIGAVELAGIADAITPAKIGMRGDEADQMAGLGLVMLGPWTGWVDGLGGEDAGERE